jgi:proline dehydrogenase
MSEFKLDFQNTATAFADKTNSELREKQRLFRVMNSPTLVSLGTRATNLALSLGLPVSGLIKHTIYEQFCGGETIEESARVIEKLGRSHIGSILDYSVEGKSEEEDFEFTKDEIIRTIERAAGDPNMPFSVFKVTGIAPLGTLEKVSAGIELPEKASSNGTASKAASTKSANTPRRKISPFLSTPKITRFRTRSIFSRPR